MQLRDYQGEMYDELRALWLSGVVHLMGQLETGGGKTALIGKFASDENELSAQIAHRQELVLQIAMALAAYGIYHRIIAPAAVVAFISDMQYERFGRSFVQGDAPAAVVSVDTMNSREETLARWVRSVKLVQGDEGHHWLMSNKWGKAYERFTNARGILWTATPRRSDRKSLLRGEGGIAQRMVKGPTGRELMDRGYLSRYVVYGPKPSYNREQLTVGNDGDFTQPSVQAASRSSQIIGDVLEHWFKLCRGLRTLTFLTDVRQSFELAERFAQHGVRAVAMSSEHTASTERAKNMQKLERGELDVVVNVDLFGEGTDVPVVGAIQDGAATRSLTRFKQRLGRLLRPKPDGSHGVYVDHVGNYLDFVDTYGCRPEDFADYDLTVPAKRPRLESDEAGLTACVQCFLLRERYKRTCPYCGFTPQRQAASAPEQVDGDLEEYTPELLAKLSRKADQIVSAVPRGVPTYLQDNMNQRALAQQDLRTVMGWWGYRHGTAAGLTDSEAWRLFYLRFRVDVATAKTLGAREALELKSKLEADL